MGYGVDDGERDVSDSPMSKMLPAQGKITPDHISLLNSWRHSRFKDNRQEEDFDALEWLAAMTYHGESRLGREFVGWPLA